MEKRSNRRKKEKSLLFAILIILLVVFGFGEIITVCCFNAKILSALESGIITMDAAWEAGMIENIIGIISLAVSVWLGLNLYEIYKKTDADNMIDKLEETNRNMVKEGLLRNFLMELQKTASLYEISDYFYNQFTGCDKIPDDLLKIMYETERQFSQCCAFYEVGKKDMSYEFAEVTEKKLKELKARLNQYKEKEDSLVYRYYFVRLADVYYYQKNQNKEELIRSIAYYVKEMKIQEETSSDKQLLGYMENTIGYTYLLLEKNYKNDVDDVDWRLEAYNYLTLAIEHNEKGRYFQNLGAYYEYIGRYDKAYLQYVSAFNASIQDPKIYNLLGTVCLKIVDEILKVDTRFERKKWLCEIKKKKIKKNELAQIQQWIQDGYNWLSIAVHIPDTVVNSYYNYVKACYYYNAFVRKDKEKIELIDIYLRLCEQIGVKERGYLYTLRNYHEIMGEIDEANKVNELLIVRDKNGKEIGSKCGDALKARKLYGK